MKEITIIKQVKVQCTWDNTRLQVSSNAFESDAPRYYWHEGGLPEWLQDPQIVDEIRKHRQMGSDEFYGPDGYVKFEMRNQCACAVQKSPAMEITITRLSEDGEIVSFVSEDPQVTERYRPLREHLQAWFFKHHPPARHE
jgi:hypothetical protein